MAVYMDRLGKGLGLTVKGLGYEICAKGFIVEYGPCLTCVLKSGPSS